MNEKRHEGGFTLIELLIVIIILAILAAIVVFAVGTTGSNAKTSACSADAKTFETALEDYKAEVGQYPGFGNGQSWAGQATGVYGVLGNTTAANGQWLSAGQNIGPFMRSLPLSQHYQIVTDGNGGVFVIPAVTNGGDVVYPATASAGQTQLTPAMLTTNTVTAVVNSGTTLKNYASQPVNFDANITTLAPNEVSNICADVGDVVN
jgi:prepilin-type N-terminal cleavage/methylation domain-containing protein